MKLKIAKKYCNPNPADLAMDKKFIIEKLASMGGPRKLFGLSSHPIDSMDQANSSNALSSFCIGKASQGKQFNSRMTLCAGFEKCLGVGSNIGGEINESHVINAFQAVGQKL